LDEYSLSALFQGTWTFTHHVVPLADPDSTVDVGSSQWIVYKTPKMEPRENFGEEMRDCQAHGTILEKTAAGIAVGKRWLKIVDGAELGEGEIFLGTRREESPGVEPDGRGGETEEIVGEGDGGEPLPRTRDDIVFSKFMTVALEKQTIILSLSKGEYSLDNVTGVYNMLLTPGPTLVFNLVDSLSKELHVYSGTQTGSTSETVSLWGRYSGAIGMVFALALLRFVRWMVEKNKRGGKGSQKSGAQEVIARGSAIRTSSLSKSGTKAEVSSSSRPSTGGGRATDDKKKD